MKKISKLIALSLGLSFIFGTHAFAGKYETLPSQEERRAEDWSSLRKNIGRQFWAVTQKDDSLVFIEASDFYGRKFKVLEKEDFVVADIFEKESVIVTVANFKMKHVWIKVKFSSGKIGFIPLKLDYISWYWLGSEGRITDFGEHLDKKNIFPKGKNSKLDESLKSYAHPQ